MSQRATPEGAEELVPVPPLDIEYVDPRALVPDPENPRVITDEEFANIVAGLREFGLREAIIVRDRASQVIVSGHQRTKAAIALNWAAVPVTYTEDLTPAQREALAILLNNQKAQGKFDLPRLGQKLHGLKLAGFDMKLTGYSDVQVRALLPIEVNGKASLPALDALPDVKVGGQVRKTAASNLDVDKAIDKAAAKIEASDQHEEEGVTRAAPPSSNQTARYPVAFVLTGPEWRKWEAEKKRLGTRDDKVLVLNLMNNIPAEG